MRLTVVIDADVPDDEEGRKLLGGTFACWRSGTASSSRST